jgi:hypothetical protein
MRLVIKTSDDELWISQLLPPFRFISPFDGQDFALLLVGTDSISSAEEREFVCREIVRQGCRYAVCAGEQCELWHDLIDDAYLAESHDDSPSPDQMMMTTWHTQETLNEVVWHFRDCAISGEFRPRRWLVLIFGGDPELNHEIASRVSECFEL